MSEAFVTHGAPSWIEHTGSDPTAARDFYRQALDWTIGELPMKDGSSYPGILLGEQPVGGISPRPAPTGAWTVYITVDDVDARHQRAIDAGARSVSPPMTMPGVGRMATIEDPFGATIALITYEPPEE